MGLYLKIAVGLVLLVQVFHLGSFQNATDSPRRTINKDWLRELAKNTAASQNAVNTEEELDGGSTNDDSSGIASGSMAILNEGEENVTRQDKRVKETSPNPTAVTSTLPPKFPTSVTTKKAKSSDTIAPPTNATSDPSNPRQVNKKVAEEEFHNSTATPQNSKTDLSGQNSTSSSVNSHIDSQKTTLAPESNNTQESTTKPNNKGLTTESTKTTTATPTTPTMKQEKNKTSTKSSSTTVFTSETTRMNPATTVAPIILEKSTKTDKDAATGSNSERGLATDKHNSKRNGAWGAVLGTAVAVACVGLVAYIILKKKHQKGFSHRKLNEDYPSEPVHRLDNGTPLDLNFGVGGSAYYNPGLQGDNIQMSNFPGRR